MCTSPQERTCSTMNQPVGSTSPTATTSSVTVANRWDHLLARIGVNRSGHRIEPGLYTLGNTTQESPVFVTANYTLSFDALRWALAGITGYVLVLDTKGINVWCAAGKGTFGTDELVHRINSTRLAKVVRHRKLILPQLGAPGVAAREVKMRSGFNVEYGPVRASDLPEFMRTGHATPAMRTVTFGFTDRAVLIPVEFRLSMLLIIAVLVLFLFGENATFSDAGWLAAVLAGMALFPLVLPWLPTRDFSSKGFVLGGIVSVPFIFSIFFGNGEVELWRLFVKAGALLLAWTPITAFLALNFTGSSTFTSRSSVRREIFTYIPVMVVMFGVGIISYIILLLF